MTTSARSVALEAVRRVTEHDAYSSIVVRTLLKRSALDDRDRSLATNLAFGTLRRLRTLDFVIEARASRPLARMSNGALATLRLGAYQLRYTNVPPHAAVSESVDLAAHRERGFVNAVLRRLAADPPALPEGPSDEDVAIRTGLNPWAVAELRHIIGDEAENAAEAIAERASLCLRVNTCRTSLEELTRALGAAGHELVPASIDRECLTLPSGDPARLPGFEEGWFAVQDQASTFVVRTLDPRPGERILDVCAAPGGKAAMAACLVQPDGRVVAADVRVERTALIRQTATRLGVSIHAVAQDARAPAVRSLFDGVLVDAPCSGIGSARRRPELLWRPRKEDLSALARLQVAIASKAADSVRPGGRLIYSVCTFPRAETDAACDAILRHRPDLEPLEFEGPDGRARRVRLWPHRHGSDGMFVAAFRRRE